MIGVRPATLDSDRGAAIELLRSNLNPAYDVARFEWLYRANPAGRGRLWLAVDSTTGEAVGTAGVFPRQFTVDGRAALSWVLGDFCIGERYRALGPALTLQRACLEVAADPGACFWYDFPSKAMVTVYRRLRIEPRGVVHRLVRPLRLDHKLAEFIRLPRLARGVSVIVNRALARRYRCDVPGVTIERHAGPCGDEFTRLADSEAAAYGVCVRRSAAYLNWRYRADPTVGHEILTARSEGRLLGYVVLTVRADTGTLTDLFGVRDRRILAALADAAVRRASERKCASVVVSLLDTHPWMRMFRGLGFVARDSNHFMLVPSSSSAAGQVVERPARLFLMYGDRDS
jgi:hypothetical protein